MLKPENGVGVEQVILAITAPLVLAPFVEQWWAGVANRIGVMMVFQSLPSDLRQTDATDA